MRLRTLLHPMLPWVLGALLALSAARPAAAVDLTVTHFGEGMYGVPFAVAREKGFFKAAGIDVTGFLTSAGGGTTIRNAMASDIPYGEVALPAAIAAIQQGLDITIVHSGATSVADLVWITRKDEAGINGVADLKGRRLGYSGPKSATDMISTMILDSAGLNGQVERKAVGSVGAALTALREKAVDVVYGAEPIWSKEQDKYKLVMRSSDFLPHVTQTVGIVQTDFLKKNPELIRRLIAARRQGVDFVRANPDEAATIYARAYKLDIVPARAALMALLAVEGRYWSPGGFDYEGMATMLRGLVLVEAIQPGPFDWSKVIDDSYLPADLRKPRS